MESLTFIWTKIKASNNLSTRFFLSLTALLSIFGLMYNYYILQMPQIALQFCLLVLLIQSVNAFILAISDISKSRKAEIVCHYCHKGTLEISQYKCKECDKEQ